MDLRIILVEESKTILEAMGQLEQAATKNLYVVKKNKLVASLTDGDIRRWVLSKGDMNAAVRYAANYQPKYLIGSTYEEAIAYMKFHVIESVPVVNEVMEIEKVYFLFPKEDKSLETLNIPVVIMAGGEGKRLYPYTNILPKPLIPIGELPILEHIINQFHRYGCNNYYVIVNHKRNMIKAYFNEIEKSYKLHFVDEHFPLGTGGGLWLLKGEIDETFILSNCDILIEEDMSTIYKHHKKQGNMITVICSQKQVVIPYGIIEASESGDIVEMREKPELSFLTNTGCYVVEPEVLNLIPEETCMSFPEIIELCKRKDIRVGVYIIKDEQWLDMGQLDELEKMKKRLQIEDM